MRAARLCRYGYLIDDLDRDIADLTRHNINGREIVTRQLIKETNLLPRGMRASVKARYQVYDCTGPADVKDDIYAKIAGQWAAKVKLRESQVDAYAALMSHVRSTPRSGILQLPCGFGKTVLACRMVLETGRRTIIVTNRKRIRDQFVDTFARLTDETFVENFVGEFSSQTCDTDKPIVIVMIDTFVSRFGKEPTKRAPMFTKAEIDQFDITIFDECHHFCADGYLYKACYLMTRHVIGLSATPYRHDGRTPILMQVFDQIFFKIEQKIQSGSLIIHIIDTEISVPYQVIGGEEDTSVAIANIVKNIIRIPEFVKIAVDLLRDLVRANKIILVLCDRVEQIMTLAKQLGDSCGRLGFAIGDSYEIRPNYVFDNILFGTTQIAKEAMDVQKLNTLVNLSTITDMTQAIGRINRQTSSSATIEPRHVYEFKFINKLLVSNSRKREQFYIEIGAIFDEEEELPSA